MIFYDSVPTANVVAVPDVFDRVDAMPVMFQILPAEALDGSGFAEDAAVVSLGPMTLFAHAYKTVLQVSSSPRAWLAIRRPPC